MLCDLLAAANKDSPQLPRPWGKASITDAPLRLVMVSSGFLGTYTWAM